MGVELSGGAGDPRREPKTRTMDVIYRTPVCFNTAVEADGDRMVALGAIALMDRS